jgi:hypothetical protein
MKKLRTVGSWLLALVIVAEPALACPVCFGDPNSTMVKGANNAILFMLGIVAVIWIGFAALFWSFWKRAKDLRRRREEFYLIQGGLH